MNKIIISLVIFACLYPTTIYAQNRILFVTSNQDFYGNTSITAANHFEEIVVPYDVFTKAGYTVDFISPKGGAIVMATTKYEVTYIIKPDVDEDNKKALVENYDTVIADNGGTMVESKDWGKRRFAYEIDKYREGTYHIMTFTADNADAVNEFSRLSKIDNDILRSMTVKLDK